jgi:hypothetical protein
MRTAMLIGILALAVGACDGDEEAAGGRGGDQAPPGGGEASPPPPPETAPPATPPPTPSAPPTGRSIVRTASPAAIEGAHPDAAWLVDRAQQRAAECYARTPSRQGAIDVVIEVAADGHVASVTASRDTVEIPEVVSCMQESIGRLHVRPQEGAATRITTSWRFEVIHDIDHDRDCSTDLDCGLASGVCEGPVAARRATADQIDARHREEASRARCASPAIVPARARCVEGLCTAVPADAAALRRCTAAADCVAVERRCGWDAFASAQLAEAQAIAGPEREGLVCDPERPAAPAVQCAAGFCTADWAPAAAP